MNRHAALTTCLACSLAAIVVATTPGCVLIGAAVGSAADSSGTSDALDTAEASTGGDTAATRRPMASRPSTHRSQSGASTGALIGLMLDTIAVAALLVAVSNHGFMSGWETDTTSSTSDCTSSCGGWGCC